MDRSSHTPAGDAACAANTSPSVHATPDPLFYRGLGYGLFMSSLLWGALLGAVYYLV